MPRLPLSKPFLASYPLINIDEMKLYKPILVQYMKRVFRNLVSLEVSEWIDGLNRPCYRVDIQAINSKPPASMWNQFIVIDRNCASLSIYGGQREAVWFHRPNYLNKILRVISNWLATIAEDKLSAQRQRLRMAVIKREIIARTVN
jgi:hypothetical protein